MILDTIPPTAVWLLATIIALSFFVVRRKLRTPLPPSTSHLPLPPGPRGLDAVRSVLRGVRSGSFHLETGRWGPAGSPLTCCSSVLGQFVSVNSPQLVRELMVGRDTEAVVNDRPPTFIGPFLFYGPKVSE